MHRFDVPKEGNGALSSHHPDDEAAMDQLREQRLKFISREEDIEGVNTPKNNNNNNSNSGTMCIQQPEPHKDEPEPPSKITETPEAVARRRKSHPWKTDVKLNRFGGAVPSTRTQKSTLGWKQRMQERKAVFGNVAVMEDTDGEEEEESIGADEEEIREEAHELLKNKGFQGLPPPSSSSPPTSARSLRQEILTQHYEDDLVSVGPGESLASSKGQQEVRLDEIQSLRQQILQRQQNREKQNEQPTETENSLVAEFEDEEEMFPEMDENELAFYTFKKQRVLQAMMQRVAASNPRGVEQVLEAVSNAWKREQSGEQPRADADEHEIAAWKVMHELKVRLKDVCTADHVCVVAMGRKGLGGVEEPKRAVAYDHNAFNRFKLRDAVEKRVSQVFTGDHVVVSNHTRTKDEDELNSSDEEPDHLNDSFAADISSRTAASDPATSGASKSPTALRESLVDSFSKFESLLGKVKQEEDEWTECTMSVAEPKPSVRQSADMLPSLPAQAGAQDDDQSVYTEYTIETINENISNDVNCEKSGCIGNSTTASRPVNNTQQQVLKSIGKFFGGREAEHDDYTEVTVDQRPAIMKVPSADSGCTDYTVHQVADPPPFRLPSQPQLPTRQNQQHEDASYMEVTVNDMSQDDQSYMELTVQETVSPLRSPNRETQQQLSQDDDQSYMELTVQDTADDKQTQSKKEQSSYMSTMLSSRMFSDMGLTPGIHKQQSQQKQDPSEYDDENFPTITVGQHYADDDMTQITFDHNEWEEYDDTRDHYHAQTYLDRKLDSSSHTSNGVVTSPASVSSRHTDPTDDESSSHNGSFKSAMSTESSQSIAKLLRQDVWSRDAEVVRKALEKLGEVASHGYQQRAIVTRYGGLLAILRAIEMNQDHVSVLVAACDALEKMARDPDTQIAIAEVGGFATIANAMKAHIESVDVQKAACNLLGNLTCQQERSHDDQIPADGIVEAIAMTMTRHAGVAEIQANSFKALANLCLESSLRLRELSNVGGLAAMTMALQKPWLNKMEQHEAISTLSILLRSLAELE